jgi:hypothetical protein
MTGIGHGLQNADILRRKVEGTNEPIIAHVVRFFDQHLRCAPSTNCSTPSDDKSGGTGDTASSTPPTPDEVGQNTASETPPVLVDEVRDERIGFWQRFWNFITRLFRR